MLSLGLAAAGLALAHVAPASAAPLISEVYYDAVGSDDGLSFIELWGEPGTDLGGLSLEGVNGSGGAVTHHLALAGQIGPDGFFVLADGLADGSTLVAEADLILNFDLQNGPDSLQLLAADASVIDAVGYGEFAPGEIFAGEGLPALDPPAGQAVARRFANLDSDDNAQDFGAAAPSPGTGPLAAVPEPGTGLLFAAGLAGLTRAGRRRPALSAAP
jgi:hypothetical protein